MQMVPQLRAMHHQYPTAIEEEIELLDLDFASYTLEWYARVPRWRDFYLSLDQRVHYAYMKKVLQVLTFLRGPNRWVLKSPQHLEQIPALLATFPDATFAITHRDPVSVIQSAATMLGYGDRMRRAAIEPEALAEYWVDRVDRLLRACVRDRDLLPPERSIDVVFHEFMADDVGMVEHIYDRAALPMTPAARGRLDTFMAENPRGKHGRLAYDLRGDFGLDPADGTGPLRLLLRTLSDCSGGPMTDGLRTAIVGCGAISHWHLDAIDRAGVPMTITAAVDPVGENADRIAARTGATAYGSLEAALDDGGFRGRAHRGSAPSARAGCDRRHWTPACTCCSRSRSHRQSTRAIACSPRRATPAPSSWSPRTRSTGPRSLTVRDLIADGAIGEVVTARAATFFPALGDFYGGDSPWRFDQAAAGGGVVIDTGSHWLRPLRIWLGEVDEVVAALGHPDPRMEGESLCRALLRFDSGTDRVVRRDVDDRRHRAATALHRHRHDAASSPSKVPVG